VVLPAWSDGVLKAGAVPTTVTAAVKLGGTADTVNWSWSRTSTAGITTTISGAAVTITAISSSLDSGIVTITGTKAGFSNVVVVVAVSKAKDTLPSAGPADPGNVNIRKAKLSGAGTITVTAKLEFRADGTVYAVRSATGDTTLTTKVRDYYLPTTGAIGAGYTIEFNNLPSDFPGGTKTESEGVLSSTRFVQLSRTQAAGNWTYDAQWSYTITRNSDDAYIGGGIINAEIDSAI
jgi:hypothetical protein